LGILEFLGSGRYRILQSGQPLLAGPLQNADKF
jgi:hypothetical protein